MKTGILTLAILVAVPAMARPAEPEAAALLATIKAVKGEGDGNVEAAKAWKALVALGPAALPATLAAVDNASPRATNWLQTAVDAIAEQALAAGKPLDPATFARFARDRRHAGLPRVRAYEWLARLDPTAPAWLMPTMLDDPAAELRRLAVDWALKDAPKLVEKRDKEALKKLFAAALDQDQVDVVAARLKELGEKVDLPVKFGVINRWLLVGPFDNTNTSGFDRVFPPEQKIDPKATLEGKAGKPLKWIENVTTDPYGLVDLNVALGKNMGAVGYAFAAVESASERPVEIRAGSNNAVKIFLNGKQLFFRHEYHHGMHVDQYVGRGMLKVGRNEILMKVCQNEQTDNWAQKWSFQVRLTDAIGAAVPVKVLEEKP